MRKRERERLRKPKPCTTDVKPQTSHCAFELGEVEGRVRNEVEAVVGEQAGDDWRWKEGVVPRKRECDRLGGWSR